MLSEAHGPMNPKALELMRPRAYGPSMGAWAHGSMDPWANGIKGLWAVGSMGLWAHATGESAYDPTGTAPVVP